jgi:hypothetical protein
MEKNKIKVEFEFNEEQFYILECIASNFKMTVEEYLKYKCDNTLFLDIIIRRSQMLKDCKLSRIMQGKEFKRYFNEKFEKGLI